MPHRAATATYETVCIVIGSQPPLEPVPGERCLQRVGAPGPARRREPTRILDLVLEHSAIDTVGAFCDPEHRGHLWNGNVMIALPAKIGTFASLLIAALSIVAAVIINALISVSGI